MTAQAMNPRRSRFDLKPDATESESRQSESTAGHENTSHKKEEVKMSLSEKEYSEDSTKRRLEQPESESNDISKSSRPSMEDSNHKNVPSVATPATENEAPKRQKRSRWAEGKSEDVAGLVIPTALSSNMSKYEQDFFVVQLRIEEIGQKLRTGDIFPPEDRRSPSPEPEYDTNGKRLNTREVRYRKRFEDERHRLIEDATRFDPLFRPPTDYKRPTRVAEKLYLPVKDNPEFNFVGLLIGPRGSTLKRLEADTGAKISIRGKGASKEGKVQDSASSFNENEDLHCYVTADSDDKVRKAISAIKKIVQDSTNAPDELNEMKKQQLRELAILNGTYRGEDHVPCHTCGQVGHKSQYCPERRNFTQQQICHLCQGVGHLSRDCRSRNERSYTTHPTPAASSTQMDDEYRQLMAQLGESTDAATVSAPSKTESTNKEPLAVSESPLQQDTENVPKDDAPTPTVTVPPTVIKSHAASTFPAINPLRTSSSPTAVATSMPSHTVLPAKANQGSTASNLPSTTQMPANYAYDYQQYYQQYQQYAQYYGYAYDPAAYSAYYAQYQQQQQQQQQQQSSSSVSSSENTKKDS